MKTTDGDAWVLNVVNGRAVKPVPMGFACYVVTCVRGAKREAIADLEHRGIVETQGEADIWLSGATPDLLVDVWRAPEAPRYAS